MIDKRVAIVAILALMWIAILWMSPSPVQRQEGLHMSIQEVQLHYMRALPQLLEAWDVQHDNPWKVAGINGPKGHEYITLGSKGQMRTFPLREVRTQIRLDPESLAKGDEVGLYAVWPLRIEEPLPSGKSLPDQDFLEVREVAYVSTLHKQ